MKSASVYLPRVDYWHYADRNLAQSELSAFGMPGEALVRLAIAKVVRHRSLFAMRTVEAIVFARLLPRPGATRPDDRIAELMAVATTVYRFPGYHG